MADDEKDKTQKQMKDDSRNAQAKYQEAAAKMKAQFSKVTEKQMPDSTMTIEPTRITLPKEHQTYKGPEYYTGNDVVEPTRITLSKEQQTNKGPEYYTGNDVVEPTRITLSKEQQTNKEPEYYPGGGKREQANKEYVMVRNKENWIEATPVTDKPQKVTTGITPVAKKPQKITTGNIPLEFLNARNGGR